ncbi:MAG: divergent polysaccharide deacetylase family protein [Pseudomonadota bacterium]
MGGFFGGLLTGAVFVVVVAGFASLSMPLEHTPVVSDTSPQAATGETVPADPPEAGGARDADLVELAPHAPNEPTSEAGSTGDVADTATATQPAVSDPSAGLSNPDTDAAANVELSGDAPVTALAPAQAPEAPQGSGELATADTTPATPTAQDPEPPQTEETAEAAPTPEAGTQQPDTDASQPEAPAAPEVETTPETLPAPEAEVEAPKVAALPQVGDDGADESGPSIGTRVIPLTERNKPAPTPVATPVAEAPASDLPPLQAYAQSFENPEDKPLMAIVLIDDLESLGAEALQDFPYPVSFAVDPADPKAVEKMARHRAAGFEVVAVANLPLAATAQDAEVALSVWLDELPETVAILEGVGSGVQGNRGLSDQVTAIARGTGRGLVTQDNGLNTVQKLAVRSGVPSAVVFRDFDGAGQTDAVMRRFLDQAAFRAGQEGAVIMLGRVRPETVTALTLWALQDRISRVAMAPVSAVLQQSVDQ